MSFCKSEFFEMMCPDCQSRVTKAKRKQELLEHYAEKEANRFDQFDGLLDSHPDNGFLPGDADGDALCECMTWELRGAIPVRVQILEGTPKADALRLLQKIVDLYSRTCVVCDLPCAEKGNPAGMCEDCFDQHELCPECGEWHHVLDTDGQKCMCEKCAAKTE